MEEERPIGVAGRSDVDGGLGLGCSHRVIITGFYCWGWEFLTALLVFSL